MPTQLYFNDFEAGLGSNPSGVSGWQAIYAGTPVTNPIYQTLPVGTAAGEGYVITAGGDYWEDNNHVAPGIGMVNLLAISFHKAQGGLIGNAANTLPCDLRNGYAKMRIRARDLYLPQATRLSWWIQTMDPAVDNGQGKHVNYFQVRNRLDDALGFTQPFERRTARSATVTVSVATPGVVTWAGHGLAANDPLYISTTGALPTGITAGSWLYVKTVLSSDTFTVSSTQGGAAINTSGGQSGTHTGTAGGQTLTTGWIDWTCSFAPEAGNWAAMRASVDDAYKYGESYHIKHALSRWNNDMGLIAIHDSALTGNLITGNIDISSVEVWGA